MNLFELVPESILTALISGLFAILGAVTGCIISSKSANSAARLAALSEAHSRVVVKYSEYFTTEQSYPPSDLIGAIEVARMLSSKRTGKVLRSLEVAILQKNPDIETCGALLEEFRSAARKETRKK